MALSSATKSIEAVRILADFSAGSLKKETHSLSQWMSEIYDSH